MPLAAMMLLVLAPLLAGWMSRRSMIRVLARRQPDRQESASLILPGVCGDLLWVLLPLGGVCAAQYLGLAWLGWIFLTLASLIADLCIAMNVVDSHVYLNTRRRFFAMIIPELRPANIRAAASAQQKKQLAALAGLLLLLPLLCFALFWGGITAADSGGLLRLSGLIFWGFAALGCLLVRYGLNGLAGSGICSLLPARLRPAVPEPERYIDSYGIGNHEQVQEQVRERINAVRGSALCNLFAVLREWKSSGAQTRDVEPCTADEAAFLRTVGLIGAKRYAAGLENTAPDNSSADMPVTGTGQTAANTGQGSASAGSERSATGTAHGVVGPGLAEPSAVGLEQNAGAERTAPAVTRVGLGLSASTAACGYKRIILICMESLGQKMLGRYNPLVSREVMPFLHSLLDNYPRLDRMMTANMPTNQGLYALHASRLAYERDMEHALGRVESLPTLLREQGFHSIALSGVTRHYGDKDVFFTRLLGYDEFLAQEDLRRIYPNAPSCGWGLADSALFHAAVPLLAQHREGKLLLQITTADTHPGYYHTLPEDVFPESVRNSDSRLLRSLFEADLNLMFFFRTLGKARLYDDSTLIIITGDHSPNHGNEYMRLNGLQSLEPDLVPLVFVTRNPAANPFRALDADTPCSQLDLLPTLIDGLGLRHVSGTGESDAENRAVAGQIERMHQPKQAAQAECAALPDQTGLAKQADWAIESARQAEDSGRAKEPTATDVESCLNAPVIGHSLFVPGPRPVLARYGKKLRLIWDGGEVALDIDKPAASVSKAESEKVNVAGTGGGQAGGEQVTGDGGNQATGGGGGQSAIYGGQSAGTPTAVAESALRKWFLAQCGG
ncbi:LTA synthase family protein [Desulfovibrio sp. OttesenSCG-928-C06]|nr:LTA synthase family protein [Desulfovibrio sp. OttesenSCG-928-C06]